MTQGRVIWIGLLLVGGLIVQAAWTGWLIIAVAALMLYEPFWARLEERGKDTKEPIRRVIAIVISIGFGIGALGSFATRNTLAEGDALLAETKDTLSKADEIAKTNALVEKSLANGGAVEPGTNWVYDSQTDVMSDKKTRTACVVSDNEVDLDSPYDDVRAKLCLRDHPQYGRDVYVTLLGDGQILCRSYSGCRVRVRFDKDAARNYSANGSSDGSSNIIFIEDRRGIEKKLASAKTMAVQAEFYQAGSQAMVFDVAGFAWPKAGD